MRKAAITAAILVAALCLVSIILTASGRLWWRSVRYTVVVRGVGVDSTVYSGRDVLLVNVGGSSAESYVVYPSLHELGVALQRRFVNLPGCVLSLDNPATYIPIGKLEVQAWSSFGDHRVEFGGVRGEAILVRW